MSLITSSTSPPKQPGSKEIIEEFLASPLKRCIVLTDELDRKPNSVYVSLRQYIANHDEFHIQVSLQDGQITLTKE